MAKQEHVDILHEGVDAWNRWREQYPDIEPDLSEANLGQERLWLVKPRMRLVMPRFSKMDLRSINLSEANLSEANLSGVNLNKANLSMAVLSNAYLGMANLGKADLRWADLSGVNLSWASLRASNLCWANLSRANLREANLSKAKLRGAYLKGASLFGATLTNADLTNAFLGESLLVETKLKGATLVGCEIYGISAWGLDLDACEQRDLIITPYSQPRITVDNLEVAQFIYILLNNRKIRDVIDTITSKVVLILGRFTPERKAVLDGLRDALRQHNYSPVLFDFERPASRDMTETISTLAHLARFVVVDITDPTSVPQEMECIVPNLPSVPIQPLLQGSSTEYGMFEHFRNYPWVLEIHRYSNHRDLLESLEDRVIGKAEAKREALLKERPF